jgi:hypothetical protein
VSYTSCDAVGNRLTLTSKLSAVPAGTFSYDNDDRLTTDTYDANGKPVSSAESLTYLYRTVSDRATANCD